MNRIPQSEQNAADAAGVSKAILSNAPVQTGVGVSVITLVTQVFARDEVQSVVPLPAIAVAMLTALLLALHNVRFVQRATTGESLVLVPLSAIILFSMALGANNLVSDRISGDDELAVLGEALEANRVAQEALQSRLTRAAADTGAPGVANRALSESTTVVESRPRFRGPTEPAAEGLAPVRRESRQSAREREEQARERARLEELQRQRRLLEEQRKRLLKKKRSLWQAW